MVLDASRKLSEEDMEILESLKNKKTIVLLNKMDLEPQIELEKIDALFKAYESINDAISAIEQRMPYDFIEVDFKNIWDYLGYINGDTVREDLLDTIFANFCIGK